MRLFDKGKVIIGYDLSDSYAQISYFTAGSDQIETVSSVGGAKVYCIPTVLCKREGLNQWFYGRDALRYAEENQGIQIEELLSLAIDGEPILIEGESYNPVALLTLFVKRSLQLLSGVAGADKISAMMVTCEKLDNRTLEVLNQVIAGLQLKTDQIFFQCHAESFYHYMIYQPEELWRQQAVLCEYQKNELTVYRMGCNKRTIPIVVYIDQHKYPFVYYEPIPEEKSLREQKLESLDRELLRLLEKVCENQLISAAYLIGENFSEEWLQESLRYLCKGKRVFLGNNLFSKGACYAMMERMEESENGKAHVYLGDDKLKFNIGMKVMRRGQESYLAILDAGVNWYEAERELEFYLQESQYIELIITSLIGGKSKAVRILLPELSGGISRLRAQFSLKDEEHLKIKVEDLGFGVIRPATFHVWEEELEL
ncbi:MAG: hypothetical protein IJF07_03620 [Lachnospiraceae bacterium]|nr:hypothetical protein [Lachnospiraceae bacterium]